MELVMDWVLIHRTPEDLLRLAADAGFSPQDCGPLANARLLEPFAMTWIWLAVMGGLGREFIFQLIKR